MLKDIIKSDTTENNCGGCGLLIRDRFYLLAADRAWHGACLRCCRCSQPLDTELSCFSRDGNIYCKDDYYRLFALRRCARCGAGLGSNELVMRAREFIYHVNCFSCLLCGLHLNAGDTAVIRSGRVFCGDHYDSDILSESLTQTEYFTDDHHHHHHHHHHQHFQLQHQQLQQHHHQQQLQQKGRPRKRKPLLHQQQNIESSDIDRSTPMRIDLLQNELQQTTNASTLDLSYDGSQSPGSVGSMSARSKRMRTSFKHHQLRSMKTYFAINQNPDAKDLKQLAQKTGLSKRVLQVWFQNARAKWRRNVMRSDGTNINNNNSHSSNNSSNNNNNNNISISNINCNSNQMAGNLTPLTSGGSPSVQSTTSSNMDSGMTPLHALDDMHQMTFAELY